MNVSLVLKAFSVSPWGFYSLTAHSSMQMRVAFSSLQILKLVFPCSVKQQMSEFVWEESWIK